MDPENVQNIRNSSREGESQRLNVLKKIVNQEIFRGMGRGGQTKHPLWGWGDGYVLQQKIANLVGMRGSL